MRRAPLSMQSALLCAGIVLCATFGATPAQAGGTKGTARAAMQLFADHCFSPFMTANKAARSFALTGMAYDFYDLDPYSNVAPSPALARPATPNTDRRCEISFVGGYAEDAAQITLDALNAEGIKTPASLPAQFANGTSTTLLAARQLNPHRVAIVHVGTRSGVLGTETFMLVERLTPAASLIQPAKDP
jgi:hypothetical protein